MVPDTDYRIKLPVFEGPLDLLLFLIRKNELDIYDIPLESVTRQYIAVLHSMQQLDLEVAGDFFVMAASLMEIKSRMLLPRGPGRGGPRGGTTTASILGGSSSTSGCNTRNSRRPPPGWRSWPPTSAICSAAPVSVIAADRPLQPVGRLDLWSTFNLVLRRLAEKLVVGQIEDEQVTVAGKMEELLALTRTQPSFVFSGLFSGPLNLRALVATFLAVLELTRLGRLRLRQDEVFADIVCEAVPVAENPLETPAESDTLTV